MNPCNKKEQDKNFIIENYSNLEFVDDISGFRCTRCERLAIAHYYSSCNHLFCRNCKNILSMEMENNWLCPKCKKTISNINKQALETEIAINSLRIHCLNHKYGCKQIIQLNEVPNHLIVCTETREKVLPLEWSNSNSTENVMLRLDQIAHRIDSMTDIVNHNQNELEVKLVQRLEFINKDRDLKTAIKIDKIQRILDGLRSDFQVEIEKLKNDIDKKIIETINMKMEEWIKFQSTLFKIDDPSDHYPNSENQPNTNASYNNIEMKQLFIKLLESQNDIKNRFDSSFSILSANVSDITQQITLLKSESIGSTSTRSEFKSSAESNATKINKGTTTEGKNAIRIHNKMSKSRTDLHVALCELKKQNLETSTFEIDKVDDSYKWEITNVREKLSGSDRITLLSPTFSLHGYPFTCQARLEHTERQGVVLSVSFNDLTSSETKIQLKSLPRVTYTIYDFQKGDKIRVRVKDYFFQQNVVSEFGKFYFEEVLGFKKSIFTNRYVSKTSILILISVTSPALLSPISTNGTLVWKINSYQKKRQMVKDELILAIQSPGYLYTSETGYRVKAELSWDQFNKLYVRISFVTGNFDSDLPNTFSHKTTVTIFDQQMHNHFTKSVTKDVKLSKWYNIDLLSNLAILQGNYLKDGSLILKLVVEALK